MFKHVTSLFVLGALGLAPPALAKGTAGLAATAPSPSPTVAAAPAGAPDWSTSFTAKTVAAYLPSTKPRVIVVGAGDDPAASEQAAKALRTALRASARTMLVMDASALGQATQIAALDDQAIVKKAASLPVDEVTVVRVFPGGGGADSAVVTIYDKKGGTLNAFSAQRGEALGAPSKSSTGQGVSNEAAGAVANVLHTDKAAAPSDAEKDYKRKYVSFYQINVLHLQSGLVTHHLGNPYQGDQERVLDWPEFFEIVGRKDHAEFYRSRTRAKWLLLGPGIGAFLVGVGVATAGAMYGLFSPFCKAQDPSHNCIDQDFSPNGPMLGVGAGLAVVGLGALIAGAVIKNFPTSTSETVDLAVEYDKKLRQELGLPAEEKESRREAPSPSLTVVPSISPQGGGLSLSLTF